MEIEMSYNPLFVGAERTKVIDGKTIKEVWNGFEWIDSIRFHRITQDEIKPLR